MKDDEFTFLPSDARSNTTNKPLGPPKLNYEHWQLRQEDPRQVTRPEQSHTVPPSSLMNGIWADFL